MTNFQAQSFSNKQKPHINNVSTSNISLKTSTINRKNVEPLTKGEEAMQCEAIGLIEDKFVQEVRKACNN